MKGSSRMTFTMGMEGTSIQTVTIILDSGKKARGRDTASWWTIMAGFMKGSGSIVNLLGSEEDNNY